MMKAPNKNYIELFTYLLLALAGLAVIYISSLFQDIAIPKEQQDFLHYLNYNFTKPVGVVFFLAGIVIGYFSKLNPLIAGVCLFSVFPLASIVDIFINPDGHNLWPFEFAMYLGYALPTILALYLGRFVATRIVKRKVKDINSN